MCPQCGTPQNPVLGMLYKAKGLFSKNKKVFMSCIEEAKKDKEEHK